MEEIPGASAVFIRLAEVPALGIVEPGKERERRTTERGKGRRNKRA